MIIVPLLSSDPSLLMLLLASLLLVLLIPSHQLLLLTWAPLIIPLLPAHYCRKHYFYKWCDLSCSGLPPSQRQFFFVFFLPMLLAWETGSGFQGRIWMVTDVIQMKLNWTEFLESYSRHPSVLLLLLATNSETNPATASRKTTPPPSTQLLVLLLIKSAAEKVSTASTSAHHNFSRFFFFFSLISLFLWGADRNTNFVLVCIGTLVKKKKNNNNKKTAITLINFSLLNHTHPKKPWLLVLRNTYPQAIWQLGS